MKVLLLAACVLLTTIPAHTQDSGVPAMSDREKQGLRGPVKSCTEETSVPAISNESGELHRAIRTGHIIDFDSDGRTLARRIVNPDGSEWVMRNVYDSSGRLLKITSGKRGDNVHDETTYSYDQQGRLEKISDGRRNPIVFRYDDQGRKTKIAVSRREDYRANGAVAGSPFEVLDDAPNISGGGTSTTTYDEQDRPVEVVVKDSQGQVVNRAVRTYDTQGRVIEEKQILDQPEMMFPPEIRAKLVQESGLCEEELVRELRGKITELMGGKSDPYSVSYTYDSLGRIVHTRRRMFNREKEIDSS
jgi:YD repeat-containing protein